MHCRLMVWRLWAIVGGLSMGYMLWGGGGGMFACVGVDGVGRESYHQEVTCLNFFMEVV